MIKNRFQYCLSVASFCCSPPPLRDAPGVGPSPQFSTMNYPLISNGSRETPSFQQICVNTGEGLSPSWLPLSSWRQDVAPVPLSSSSRGCVPTCQARGREPEPESQTGPPHGNPTLFLMNTRGPLVLGDLEQLHGSSLVRGRSHTSPDHVPHELGVFGETLRETGVSRARASGSADDGSPDPHLPNLIGVKAARHAPGPFAQPVPGP